MYVSSNKCFNYKKNIFKKLHIVNGPNLSSNRFQNSPSLNQSTVCYATFMLRTYLYIPLRNSPCKHALSVSPRRERKRSARCASRSTYWHRAFCFGNAKRNAASNRRSSTHTVLVPAVVLYIHCTRSFASCARTCIARCRDGF